MHAKRSLGQNFLVDPNLQRKVVAALEAGPDDEVLEIGPGLGALTSHLADRVGRLVLVELDDELMAHLRRDYADRPRVEIVHGDILAFELSSVFPEPAKVKVVGNIPYNITTPILFHLLRRPRPAEIVLMVQKEVAERLSAIPGTSAYGALSVGVRTVAVVTRLFDVSRGAFRPAPQIDSALVRIRPLDPPPLDREEEVRLRLLTRASFQWRRKQMQRILRAHPDLGLTAAEVGRIEDATGLAMVRRPETFSPEEFVLLSRCLPG